MLFFFAAGSLEKDSENGAAVTSLRSFLFCDNFSKDWRLKKKAKVYPLFLIQKISEITLFFYLHFPWLYGPWQQQRILKKYPFWKHDSWFSTEVSKLTSVFYARNDAFSGVKYRSKFWYLSRKPAVMFSKWVLMKLIFGHTKHLKMALWISVLWKMLI